MYEGVGLAAAVAATCGGWTVPVHCATGAILKIACVNDETASVVVWERDGQLLYATTRVRRDTIFYSAEGALLASATVASRIFATVVRHHGDRQVSHAAGLPAFSWAPTEAVLVTTAVGMAAALTTALQIRRHQRTWVVDFLHVPSASVAFTRTGITVNADPAAAFGPVVFTGRQASPWTTEGTVDGARYVAGLASALVLHHTKWTNRLAGKFC